MKCNKTIRISSWSKRSGFQILYRCTGVPAAYKTLQRTPTPFITSAFEREKKGQFYFSSLFRILEYLILYYLFFYPKPWSQFDINSRYTFWESLVWVKGDLSLIHSVGMLCLRLAASFPTSGHAHITGSSRERGCTSKERSAPE